jgi:Type II CAAX prenyl endopeptidase Rce1-like
MEQRFEKLVCRLLALSPWLLFLLAVTLCVGNSIFWPMVSQAFSNNSTIAGNEKLPPLFEDKRLMIFFAPLVETLVFQYLLLHLLIKFIRPVFAVITAALIFGIFHFYNFWYLAAAITGGFVFTFIFYSYWIGKNQLALALLLVTMVHSAANAILFYLH